MLALVGGAVVACSDETGSSSGSTADSNTNTGSTPDSGAKDAGAKDATVGDTGPIVVTDAGVADTGATCLSKLRPPADGGTVRGPFCPFAPKPNTDGGVGINCLQAETCCLGGGKPDGGGFDPSMCVNGTNAACPAPSAGAGATTAWECTQTSDCASKGGGVCCVVSNGADAGVGFATNTNQCTIFTRESGTRCKATCGAGEFQGCQQDSDCPSGKICTLASAGSGDRIDMGYCK
jgi:hypothetical protein